MRVGCDKRTRAGTSQGCVLVFDGRPPHTLKCSLNMSLSARPYGACSALSFSPNGAKLVVGFAKGHIQLIDVRRGKVLAAITPDRVSCRIDRLPVMRAFVTFRLIKIGHGVLQVEYLHTSNTVVCVDSGGSVFVLKFGATLAGGVTVKTSCVFRCVDEHKYVHGLAVAVTEKCVPSLHYTHRHRRHRKSKQRT